MSDTLFGKEVSGTPVETRELSQNVAHQFQNLLSNPQAGAQRVAATFGLDPSSLGLQGFAQSILSGASPSIAGFQQANAPFQERAMAQANQQIQGAFGQQGARFSKNLLNAQAQQTGELQSQFNRDRFNFGQQQRGQDIQALLGLFQGLPALQQGAFMPLQMAGQYATPGAPIWAEGILGDLISAGAQIGGAKIGASG